LVLFFYERSDRAESWAKTIANDFDILIFILNVI